MHSTYIMGIIKRLNRYAQSYLMGITSVMPITCYEMVLKKHNAQRAIWMTLWIIMRSAEQQVKVLYGNNRCCFTDCVKHTNALWGKMHEYLKAGGIYNAIILLSGKRRVFEAREHQQDNKIAKSRITLKWIFKNWCVWKCGADYIPFKSEIYGPDMNTTWRESDIRGARKGTVWARKLLQQKEERESCDYPSHY